MPTQTKSEIKTSVVDISPNAAKLIESLRHVGYDNYAAVMDLVDNSLDAGATTCHIWWKQEKGQPMILIGDNGMGMDESTLNQAMRLGSLADKNPETDLGRFGMGLTTATLSLCRRVTILTKPEAGELLKGTTDIDDMVAENRFKMEIGGITSEDISLFNEITGNGKCGTVVQLHKVDRLTNTNLSVAADILRKKIGRVFRIFLQNKRAVLINGKGAEVFDPLNPVAGEASKIILDESLPFKVDGNGESREELVRIKVAFLPDVSQEMARDLNINPISQGFYVLRNLREIVDGASLDIFIKNPALNRFRAEIQVSGRMDEAIQIDFAKSKVNLRQSLADKISALVTPHISYIRKNYRKDVAKSNIERVQHSESEQEISKKAKILDLPPKPRLPQPEKSTPESKKAGRRKPEQNDKPVSPDGTSRLRKVCRFEEVDFGSQGQLYETYPDGATIVVQLNTAHPFYERIIEPYAQDPSLRNAIDFLLFSMASAEMKHSTDQEKLELMTGYKTTVSSNLRSLCS